MINNKNKIFRLCTWKRRNPQIVKERYITLLHEIGHASDCGHQKSTSSDAYPNFMSYPPPDRTGILRNQVIKLARSYFARDA